MAQPISQLLFGRQNSSQTRFVSGSLPFGRVDQRLVAAEGTLKRLGRRIRDEAKDELQRSTEQRKHEADALNAVTSGLDQQGRDRIGRYAGVAADRLRQVADNLPQHDLGALLAGGDCAAGGGRLTNLAIAERLGITRVTVAAWRQRFGA